MGGPLNLSLRDWFKPQRPEDRGLADFVFTRQLRHRLAGSVSVGDLALLAGIQRARSANFLPWSAPSGYPKASRGSPEHPVKEAPTCTRISDG
jgi:hypothetical protein